MSLRKHAYSNILKILPSKYENFQIKDSDIFHISAQNIDCGYSLELPRRGGSNEYPQSIFLSRNKKNNVYPFKPQFCYTKVGFKGVQNYIGMFSWCVSRFSCKRVFQFFYVSMSIDTYIAFVLSFYGSHHVFRCLGKVVLRDCGISWVSSLTFLYWLKSSI